MLVVLFAISLALPAGSGCQDREECDAAEYEPAYWPEEVPGEPSADHIPAFLPKDFVGYWRASDTAECPYSARIEASAILDLSVVDTDGDGTADRDRVIVIHGLLPSPLFVDPYTAEIFGEFANGESLAGRIHYDGRLYLRFWVSRPGALDSTLYQEYVKARE